MKKIVWIVIILLVIWGIMSLVGDNNESTSTEPIKIGFIGPLTGDAAAYGEPMMNITQLAVDEINEAGGIDGRQIEVIYEDGECSGKGASNAAQKLVNVDKVEVIMGGFCSSESLAIIPVAEKEKVFVLSGTSSSPDLTNISEYFARTFPSDATQGSVLANVAYNSKGWQKVAFIQEQLDYPLGIYNAFSNSFESFGGETIKEEFISGEIDFKTILSKLKSENADALFIDVQTPASAERILKQIQDLNWSPNLLIPDVVSSHVETTKKNAEVLEGAIAAEFDINPENEKFKDMLSSYESKYGTETPYQSYAQTQYDVVYLIRDAIEEVGYDGEKISKWFNNVKNWDGASGLLTIKEDGDRDGGHIPKVIKDGKSVKFE